jgi:hypothetical protein
MERLSPRGAWHELGQLATGTAYTHTPTGLFALSRVDIQPGDGPAYHVAVAGPRVSRPTDEELAIVKRDFGIEAARELNQVTGTELFDRPRHLWLPIEGAN